MGIKNIITDDLTDSELPGDTKPTKVTFDGNDYEVFLSEDSKETLTALFKGEAPLLANSKPAKAKKSTGQGRKPVDTYGYDFNEVRDFAIAEGIKAKSGTPITESTRVLNQDVYDAYKAAQTKK